MLPQIKGGDQTLQLALTKWASELNPLLAKPLSSANLLQGVSLPNGTVTINHLLGRQMQGWFVSDINAASTIFRSQPLNTLTLTLTSSAACIVDLVVF